MPSKRCSRALIWPPSVRSARPRRHVPYCSVDSPGVGWRSWSRRCVPARSQPGGPRTGSEGGIQLPEWPHGADKDGRYGTRLSLANGFPQRPAQLLVLRRRDSTPATCLSRDNQPERGIRYQA